jgi:hypothetical protein
MNKPSIEFLIKHLNLKPLWSQDYLIEFYRSEIILSKKNLEDGFDGDRPIFNWAYYLLPEGVICPFHLHLADESWQYCAGGPLELYILYPENDQLKKILIGQDLSQNQSFIHIVPKNVWFAAKSLKGSEYTLITHLVSPAFFPQDKVKGYYDDLIKKYPLHEQLLKELSWPRDWK